jgi:2-keto-3-deoxy-6-phosphogluconate aldolase
VLLEGCLKADVRVIEYTLRRQDAPQMIEQIRKDYPDLYILVGSTLDDSRIVSQCRRKHEQLMTLPELDTADVDGFVSMIGWPLDVIREYSSKRIVVPAAWTVTEAFQEVGAGAHFIKLTGPANLDLARLCSAQATFGYCPILVTGGITLDRIAPAFDSGAVVVASGFDVTLRGKSQNITAAEVAQVLRGYVDMAKAARIQAWPELAGAVGADWSDWLDALPHCHPF